ncbi:MAG TPA: hypothetical protein DCQ26_04020 [Marinilabiliales bacterium]|jgi:hypothetical protein|nr:MAG: hypothetical protein A2W95_03420 [Bacteroidetes bacterium GWA2_40_14]OFX58111.1 MAG: hypothetical protein A2W84_09095 [Bacteroidetes bacterium GWC2_40_13]OFX72749.1 MAG: hypothetical protein A2W96_18605 [Bacteroidetes bacterium GWD2_40_43]OFX91379.1 MAG: hypothetical protein A2W97_04025 [Bacteroidetes bacterium GWE2_40_63]OFY19448.1 MAG: hypothetical protein A2W88_01905 [Bacteroidetes bacterium GWF2_40_13]OFZ25597.1 MAG: hypothetical protein A2437_12310 [Bacteroidetes bacterium RIFOXYC
MFKSHHFSLNPGNDSTIPTVNLEFMNFYAINIFYTYIQKNDTAMKTRSVSSIYFKYLIS